MPEKIKVLFIFEMLGRPPEHVKNALEEFVENLGKTPGIKIDNRKIHEPHPLEDKESKEEIKGLYTTFAEVEMIVDNLDLVFKIVLNALPSSVEIIEPTSLRLNNFELSQVLSELAIKLHRYDEIAKALTLERNNLINMLKEAHMKIDDFEKKASENDKKSENKNKKKVSEKVGKKDEKKTRKSRNSKKD